MTIKEMRIKKGMSQTQVANKVYLTRQQIDNIEKGKSRLTIENAVAIAKTFDVTWVDLITAYLGECHG